MNPLKMSSQLTLAERVSADIVQAMKAKDTTRLDALRAIKTAIQKLDKTPDDTGVIRLIETLVKQRAEAIKLFIEGGRQDLADQDTQQVAVLESYLPKALTKEELTKVITETLTETTEHKQGTLMKLVMKKLVGKRVDGKLVSQCVEEALRSTKT